MVKSHVFPWRGVCVYIAHVLCLVFCFYLSFSYCFVKAFCILRKSGLYHMGQNIFSEFLLLFLTSFLFLSFTAKYIQHKIRKGITLHRQSVVSSQRQRAERDRETERKTERKDPECSRNSGYRSFLVSLNYSLKTLHIL